MNDSNLLHIVSSTFGYYCFLLILWLSFDWKLSLVMVPVRWDYCTFQYVVIVIPHWSSVLDMSYQPTYKKAQKMGTGLDKGLWSLGKFWWRPKTGKLRSLFAFSQMVIWSLLHSFSKRPSQENPIYFNQDLSLKMQAIIRKTNFLKLWSRELCLKPI